jgi:hypothetical protein
MLHYFCIGGEMKKIALAAVLFFGIFVSGCVTVPAMTKMDAREKFVSQSQKNAYYLYLARYWDDHAAKQMIDFKGASFLTVWERDGKAEISIGNGPYYGLIELIAVGKNATVIKVYAWGASAERINKWRALIENAPEEQPLPEK